MAKIVLDTTELNTGWQFVGATLAGSASMQVEVLDDLGRQRHYHIGDQAWVESLAKMDFSGLNPSLPAVVLQKLVDDGHFVGVVAEL